MFRSHRSHFARNAGALALWLLTLMLPLVLPSSARAATATFTSLANGRSVNGTQGGSPHNVGYAGTFNIQIDGVPPNVEAYCVDINNPIAPGDTVPQIPADYPSEVLFILNNAFPQPNTIGTPLPAANDEAAAVQSAIWRYTDNFIATSPSNIATRAAEIVAAANAAGPLLPTAAPQSISMDPPNATNYLPGDTSHTVTATVRDGNGDPLSGFTIELEVTSGPGAGHADNGASPELVSTYSNSTAGIDTIRATVEFQVPTGQKFKLPGKQGIVLAGDPVTGMVSGSATKSWVTPQCGNGTKEPGEQCDDGNASDDDACTTACRNNVCGDGHLGPNEACDDGNQNPNDACKNNCALNVCGDQVVNPLAEECDDGNQTNNDGCTNGCKLPLCGDSIVQTGEQCDDGNTVATDACTDVCKVAACGDGIVGPGETCDDANQVNDDGCTNACMTPRCGDGVLQPHTGEACDDGNNLSGDGCTATCEIAEICTDLQDNDNDGLIDCSDPQCGCLNFHIFCHHPCPSQITLRPGRENDILTIRTGLYPNQSFDPTTVPVSVMISNANGIIFAAVLPPGSLKKSGDIWQYNKRRADGLQLVKMSERERDGLWRLAIRAAADLSSATLSEMTMQVVIGNEAFQSTAEWQRKGNGWRVNLKRVQP